MRTLQTVGVRARLAFRERDLFGVGLPKGKNSKHRTAPQPIDWKRVVSFRIGVPVDWESLGIRKGAVKIPKRKKPICDNPSRRAKIQVEPNMIFTEHHWNLWLCHFL
jgi:hypothetical protein